MAEIEQRQEPAAHLRCPHCWGSMQGVGKHRWHGRVSGRVMRYAYRCDLCGHEWLADKRVESTVVVETRPVDVEERLPFIDTSAVTFLRQTKKKKAKRT